MARRTVPEKYLAIAAVYPKWQRAMAQVQRAIAAVEAGDEDRMAIYRAKDRLYKLVDEAAGYAHSYQDPVITALYDEISALPSIETAAQRGLEARDRQRQAEIKRLREEAREAQRPHEWMRH